MAHHWGAMSDSPASLAATLVAAADLHADRVAVRHDDQALTYAELGARVDAAAAALAEAGVGAGDRVALMLSNRVSYVVAFYAALRIGAVVVPINTSLTSPEVAHELTDSAATAMVLGRAFEPIVAGLRGTLPTLAEVFVADTADDIDAASGMRSWNAAVAGHAGADPGPVVGGRDDLAVLAYTSGTTGSPKAAMLSHGNLLANHEQLMASGAGVEPGDVVLSALPLFHSYALNVAMALTLSRGATLELVERFEPASALRLVAERGVTVIVGAPPMYVAWLNLPGADPADLAGVRLATSGAAALPARVLRQCAEELGLDIREGYGLAEAAPVVTSSAALEAAIAGCVGRPLEGLEVRIVDDGVMAADGDPGLVQVRGPNVFGGYWEAPEATAQVMTEDGWLDTGDIGYLDEGLLYLVDRAKDVIIVSGFNVYPVEVEEAIASHPAVMQAAVVGVPHPYTGEAVKAFAVLEAGAEVTADELIAHCATRVARFKLPDAVEFVTSLPTLPTGKVRRRMLR